MIFHQTLGEASRVSKGPRLSNFQWNLVNLIIGLGAILSTETLSDESNYNH